MFSLFTFVAFGTRADAGGLRVISGPALAFAAVALFVALAVMWISLLGMKLDAPAGRSSSCLVPPG